MFEESASSIPSIWASVNSWFTPTVLFVFLNLMIGTIFVTSNLANKKQQKQTQLLQDDPQNPTLHRSPSVLQRIRSINLYSYRSQEYQNPSQSINTHFKSIPDFDFQTTHHEPETLETDTQFVSDQTHEEEEEEEEEEEVEEKEDEDDGGDPLTMDEIYSQLSDHHVTRTNSDTLPSAGEIPKKLPAKMRKSASSKSAFGHFEEADIVEVRRPATVREGRAKVTDGDDDEVDAKADDFINKFKQQLKLQRLDSILRYKEVIGRGSGK